MLLNLKDLTTAEKQQWLQHIIVPRPVALVSSIDKNGNVNLSPFSFFNMVSSNPPIVIFSPSRRVRDNTIKDTLFNVKEHPEVVINMVSELMVRQTSLASCDYGRETDEFIKAGFTKQKATHVKPPMVKESPAKLECKIIEIKSLGEEGGAGQLVIAEIICLHIDDKYINTQNEPNPAGLNLVARLGADWYCAITAQNLFKVEKPSRNCGIGIDRLPGHIKRSKILTGNQLAQLANVHELPETNNRFSDGRFQSILHYYQTEEEQNNKIHTYAAELLEEGNITKAWQVLMAENEAFG